MARDVLCYEMAASDTRGGRSFSAVRCGGLFRRRVVVGVKSFVRSFQREDNGGGSGVVWCGVLGDSLLIAHTTAPATTPSISASYKA